MKTGIKGNAALKWASGSAT